MAAEVTDNTATVDHAPGLVLVGSIAGPLGVPSYQRGYRWTASEVRALLEDLAEWAAGLGALLPGAPPPFYFLQPVVVCGAPASWTIVDGQQRLTTVFLIQRVLGGRPLPRYSLTYETRGDTRSFLEAFGGEEAAVRGHDSIDLYHIKQAISVVRAWRDADPVIAGKVSALLAETDPQRPSVKVLWYPVGAEEPRALFARLNDGKIPLTAAELIRARLLRAGESSFLPEERDRIAIGWDAIEKRLHDEEFWHFICEADDIGGSLVRDGGPRIDHVFRILHRLDRLGSPDVRPEVLLHFEQALRDDPRGLWARLEHLVATLEDWFEDHEICHLVGFLVTLGARREVAAASLLASLLEQRKTLPLSAFRARLREQSWERVTGRGADARPVAETLESLSYEENDKPRIRAALLLFNLAILLVRREEKPRFSFAAFRSERWDIEHLHPQAGAAPPIGLRRREWAERVLAYPDLRARLRGPDADWLAVIEAMREQDTHPQFAECYEAVRRGYAHGAATRPELAADDAPQPEDSTHALGNLTLLDQHTNRSFGNAFFPDKRAHVVARESEGRFVPAGTRNVFLKCYADGVPDLLTWSPTDQASYLVAIKRVLTRFCEGGR